MTTREAILGTIADHKARLAAFGITHTGLYGPYAYGQQGEESAIDILVDFDHGHENFENYMNAYDYFEQILEGEKVNMVTKNDLSPYAGPEILKEVMYV